MPAVQHVPLPTGKKRRLPYLELIEATVSMHFRKMLMMLRVHCVRAKRRADFIVKNAVTLTSEREPPLHIHLLLIQGLLMQSPEGVLQET